MTEKKLSSIWMKFDQQWYLNRYQSIVPIIEDIYAGDAFGYYQMKGCKLGHSPNPYFDERWYLIKYPELQQLIRDGKFKSGFDHYCEIGYQDHSPHWLFSEEKYREICHDFTHNQKNYINGYDHYLQVGDRQLYSASIFFNPILYLAQKKNRDQIIAEGGPYQYLLTQAIQDINEIRISWFFDPVWYLSSYQDIQNLLKHHHFRSCLEHYFVNKTPTVFSPLIEFSEKFYLEAYEDLVRSISSDGNGLMRNGYLHFLQYGCKEGRKPCEEFDPVSYQEKEDVKQAMQQGLYFNVFEYWIAHKHIELLDKTGIEASLNISVPIESEENVTSNIVTIDPVKTESLTTVEGIPEPEHLDKHEQKNEFFEQKRKGQDAILMVPEEVKAPEFTVSEKQLEIRKIKSSFENVTVAITSDDPVPSSIETTKKIKKKFHSVAEHEETSEDILIETTSQNASLIQSKAITEKEISVDLISSSQNQDDENSQYIVELLQLSPANGVSWKDFDEEWYNITYPDAAVEMKALDLDSLEAYYQSIGYKLGHSPNPYFDEKWYLNTYPEIKLLIAQKEFKSGFDHYCQIGHRDHSPHWLFSDHYYRRNNPNLTNDNLSKANYINAYDYYLKVGDINGETGSPFFDPMFFMGQYEKPIQWGRGSYAHYVRNIQKISPLLRISWYFDPVWYSEYYINIPKMVKEKKYINALHHYLTHQEEDVEYSPLFWFDEHFYITEYQYQLEKNNALSTYRNGYEHFINEGISLLWKPLLSVDLGQYSLQENVKKDLEDKIYPNLFIHWVANHKELQTVNESDQALLQMDQDVEVLPSEISVLEEENTAFWQQFDEEWYQLRYPDIKEKMDICGIETIPEYYEQIGSFLGHSPNPYFDEEWYLSAYPDVRKSINRGFFKTGFEHYCQLGYKTKSPHWLFSEHYYLQQNPKFGYEIYNSTQYKNAYDHYLKKGDALRRSGSLFFDPLVYERYCYQQGKVEKAEFPYRSYLRHLLGEDKEATVSLYFQTEWYLQEYPVVHEEINEGKVSSALQHYFVNNTPLDFNPLPCFSESFYLETYRDLDGAILANGKGGFRNGYMHFVFHGSLECRQPHPDIDLKTYFLSSDVREDIENGLYRDAFAHFVFHQRLEAWLNQQPEDSHYRLTDTIKESREYFKKKANFMLPTVAHRKLDFSYEGQPDISVIMLMRNQLPVTLTALASLRSNFKGKIQLLLGDNNSKDDTRFIQNSIIGAHILRFSYNLGYGRACNYLIEHVKAPITIFLNNDIMLYPDAINVLCDRLQSADNIGAVGGKIIHPDGNLQEAGSIIWRDGATLGYLRGKDPSIPEANFVRDVDYCSAAMMAVDTLLLQQIKGFSPAYYPAYFEDTDLCVRIIQAGYRVVYDPDAVVEHMEYASSDPIISAGLQRRNHAIFRKLHADFLRFQQPQHSENVLMARQRSSNQKRILFIEDRVPLRRLGSGYVRSNDIVHQMAKLGYAVTVFPINPYYPHLYQIYSDFSETVEVLYDRNITMISEFFKERAGYYDIIWIGRTHNLNRILPMLGEANRYLPHDSIVLDSEVVAAPRTHLRAKILGLKQQETLDQSLEIELAPVSHCQQFVAVNHVDANYVKGVGFSNVNILGHMMELRPTIKTWKERKNMLFVGALHDDLSPNYDSLLWFTSAVLPILIEQMDEEFIFTIAGYVHPSVDMSVFTKYPQVKLLGPVEDLTPLYNDHRICVVPTRFAGGIPYKVQEAASFGIPVVATDLLVKQLGWKDEEDILAASIDNPDFFASQIIRLYQESELWNNLRKNALNRIQSECNEDIFRENLQSILVKINSNQ